MPSATRANAKVELSFIPPMLPNMPMTLKEFSTESRQQPGEQVAELMDLLLIDTFSEPEPDAENAWGREVDRRLAELESGKVQAIPGEEAMARMRKIVGL